MVIIITVRIILYNNNCYNNSHNNNGYNNTI